MTQTAAAHSSGGRRAVGIAWFISAVLVFLASWGVGAIYSLIALIVGLVLLVRRPTRPVVAAASLLAAAFGVYLVTLIPSSTGSELVVAILALTSFAVGLLTYGLLSRDIQPR